MISQTSEDKRSFSRFHNDLIVASPTCTRGRHQLMPTHWSSYLNHFLGFSLAMAVTQKISPCVTMGLNDWELLSSKGMCLL